MKMMRFALAAVLWVGFLAAGLATERFVVPPGPGLTSTPPYTNWNRAATNIQDAVNVSSNNDVIWVTNGTYYCWSNSAYGGYTSMVTVVRASNITIQSMNGPAVTIVNANYPYFANRCFYIMSNATLSGLTITNGHAGDICNGGGVYVNTSGRITNCWITGNSTTNTAWLADNATGGGGIHFHGGGELYNCLIYGNVTPATTLGACAVLDTPAGTYVIRDCVFSNNNAGGASLFNTTTESISNCTFINNNGVGLYLNIGVWTVDNCFMIANSNTGFSAGSSGSGFVRNCQISYNSGIGAGVSAGVMSNCVISGNSNLMYPYVGGLALGANTALVVNCTIVSNYSSRTDAGCGGVSISAGTLRNCLVANNVGPFAGGVYFRTIATTDTARVENCTIVANNSGSLLSYYGGIYCDAATGTGVVVNTICYSNFFGVTHNNWQDAYAGHLVFYNSCTFPTNPASMSFNNTTNPPALVNFAARNYRLSRSSPCINTGSNLNWTLMTGAVDLDGLSRRDRFSGIVDMGCYEFLPRGTMFVGR